jgi:3-deoxy-D-manno-octulosonic acid kinase
VEWADSLAAALLDGLGCVSAGEGGRGSLVRFAYPEGAGIIRRYRRGGVLGQVIAEGFVLVNRPLQEFELLCWLFEQELPVPPPLGVMWERRGPVVTGAIATEALNAVNLLDWLQNQPDHPEAVLRDCGALIRCMHDLGVWHADLQVANVLVAENGLYLIDFDKARRIPDLSEFSRMRNLLRFRRSLEKRGFPSKYFDSILDGYGALAQRPWLDRTYRLKGRLSDVLRRGY